jgi:branched-chain amino acid transport system permease protein
VETYLPFVISGLGIGAAYALSGVGLIVLYRATGVLNFAYGALGALSAYITWALINRGLAPLVAGLAGIGAATLGSYLYGGLIAPRLAYRERVVRAAGTLGLALVLLGFLGWYWGEGPRRLTFVSDRMFLEIFGARFTYTRGLALIVTIAMVAGIGLLLARTRVGLSMRALADNRELSAILGIQVLSVESMAWLVSGVFAGIAGIFLGDFVRLESYVLTFLVIPAIAAAIVGRLSSLWVTAAAGIAIGLAEALLTPFLSLAPYRTAAPFVVALAAIALLPAHLAGEGDH